MESCFHRECDNFGSVEEPENSINFISTVTQALIMAVYELTMPSWENCLPNIQNPESTEEPPELPEFTNSEILNDILPDVSEKLPEKNLENEILSENILENEDNWLHKANQINMKNYQPNFQGTQINIETLNIINDENQVRLFLDKLLKKRKKNSPMVLSVKTEKEL